MSISDFSSSSSSYFIVAATLALVAGTALSVELSPPTSPQSAIASLGLPVVRTDLRDRGGQQTPSRPRTVVLVGNFVLQSLIALACTTKTFSLILPLNSSSSKTTRNPLHQGLMRETRTPS